MISGVEIELALIDEGDHLNVVLRVEPLGTSDSTGGDDTGTMTGESAPRHLTSLGFTDSVISLGRTPKTEVCDVVHEEGLRSCLYEHDIIFG